MVDGDGDHAVGCGVEGVLPYLDAELDGEVWEARKCGKGGRELFTFCSRGHFL